MLELIEKLSTINGVSGDEKNVRDFLISKINADSVEIDNLGNLIVFKKGRKAPTKKIMICAHMDEVGFMISGITSDGYLKFSTIGGIDPRVVLGRQVSFQNGTIGVIGTKAVHQQSEDERDKAPKIDSMYIDIGAKDKEDAENYVSLGDCAYFVSEYMNFGDGFIKGKALDDRVGCAIMLDMMKTEQEYDCYYVFTVQEEIGTRGAKTAAFNVKPDFAIVLETTTACDISGVDGEKKVCILGDGVVVSYMDRGTIYDKELYNLAFSISKENDIKCQTKTMIAGGNDSGAIHVSVGGVRTIAFSLPCRYLHTPSCVIKNDDLFATRKLTEKMLEKLGDL